MWDIKVKSNRNNVFKGQKHLKIWIEIQAERQQMNVES